eukprot:SAG11_NODE_1252_length_5386_cov_29.101759_5_plen_150_part_00
MPISFTAGAGRRHFARDCFFDDLSSSTAEQQAFAGDFLHRDLLPAHFDTVRLINAWKAGRKLGSKLISYAYPKPLPNDTTDSTAEMVDASTENTGMPDTGTPGTGTAGSESSDNGDRPDGSTAAVVAILEQPSHHTSHSDEACEAETSQ